MAETLRVLGSPEQEAVVPVNWFLDVVTPAGPARFWRLIVAEQFAQLKHFARHKLDPQTLGDAMPADEAARWELLKFLGRSIIHPDRVVHVYQGETGPLKISTWPDDEILRLAREAAIFHGLRRAQ